jgi:hypothetical protein
MSKTTKTKSLITVTSNIHTVKINCVTAGKNPNVDNGVEAFININTNSVNLDMGRFSESLKKMSLAQCRAMTETMAAITKEAEKYLKD